MADKLEAEISLPIDDLGCLTYGKRIGLILKDRCESFAKQRMIVNHQNANSFRCCHFCSPSTITVRIFVWCADLLT